MLDRIKEIMQQKGLSPSAFADEIQVQRSSVSHILNGRNKPSLDIIQKIISRFPDIDVQWLITGKISNKLNVETTNIEVEIPFNETKSDSFCLNKSNENKELEKIVLFYKDGTFKIYHPK